VCARWRRGEPDGFTDLADRWWIAATLDLLADDSRICRRMPVSVATAIWFLPKKRLALGELHRSAVSHRNATFSWNTCS